jgi:hypothetical protein
VRKPVWLTAIAVTFIVGAVAWLIARKMWRAGYWPARPAAHPSITGFYYQRTAETPRGTANDPAEALARHPATRSKNTPERALPIGPDDDLEFLRELTERIRGEQ